MNLKFIASGTILSILPAAFGYLTQVYLVKKFGFEARGSFEFYSSILAICSTIFSLNLYTSITIYVAKSGTRPKNLVNLALLSATFQCIVAILLLLTTSVSKEGVSPIFVFLLLMTIIFNHFGNISVSILNGFGKLLMAKIIAIPGQIIAGIVLLILIRYQVVNYKAAAFTLFSIPYIIIGIVGFTLINKRENSKVVSENLTLTQLFRMSWKVFLISSAQIAFQRFYILYCLSYQSDVNVGAFAFSNSIIQLVLIPITFIATSIIASPKIAKNYFNKLVTITIIYTVSSVLLINILFSVANFSNIGLKFLSDKLFVGNLRIILFSLPFIAFTTLFISYQIRREAISNGILISQLVSLPISILFFNIFSHTNFSYPIAIAFTLLNILLGIICFLLKVKSEV